MDNHELMPAITFMERRLGEAERKVNELLGALNILGDEAGLPVRPPGAGVSVDKHAGTTTQILPDTFFGKKQQTAVREYLEMRKSQSGNRNPATPRDIYDALVAGGYQYEAKKPETALVGLRALLRKRTNVFIKVGNTGTYGLRSWYPDAKKPKEDQGPKGAEDSSSEEPLAPLGDEQDNAANSTTPDEEHASAA